MRPSRVLILVLLPHALLAQPGGADNRHEWAVEIAANASDEHEMPKIGPEGDAGFGRVAIDYVGRLRPSLTVHATADVVDGGSAGAGITEAYLRWRKLPHSPLRHELRAGAFYPPLSLENSAIAWTDPYTVSFSAINTWIAEELRSIGAEWRMIRPLGPRAANREFRFVAAGYYGNDPAGALLSWRGFALHSRQTRLGDAIRLPAVPQIQPGAMFGKQAPGTEPIVEVDRAPGFYVATEWQPGPRIELRVLHYDNHADPTAIDRGQYGWTTRFDHLGMAVDLPARLGLIVQALDGTTAMGPVIGTAHAVDNGYSSAFALLTRQKGPHRWSLRIDRFRIRDYDSTPLDDNSEHGRAWTAAWRYESERAWSVDLEWQRLSVSRPAFAYLGDPEHVDVNIVRAGLRYRIDSRRRLLNP